MAPEAKRVRENISKLTDIFGSADTVSKMLVKQYEDTQKQLAALTEENKKHADELKRLESERKKLADEKERLEKERAEHQGRAEELAKEMDSLRSRMGESGGASAEALADEMKTLAAEKAALEDKVAEEQARSETARKDLAAVQEQKNAEESRSKEYSTRIEELEAQIQTIERSPEGADRDKELSRLNELVAELKGEKETLEERLSSIDKEKEEERAKIRAEYEAEIHKLSDIVDELELQKQNMLAKIGSLEDQLKGKEISPEEYSPRKEQLDRKIAEAQEEQGKYRQRIDEIKSTLAEGDDSLSRAREVEELKRMLTDLEQSNKRLSEEAKELRSENEELMSSAVISRHESAAPSGTKEHFDISPAPGLSDSKSEARDLKLMGALEKMSHAVDSMGGRHDTDLVRLLEKVAASGGSAGNVKEKVFTLIEKIENSRVEINPMGASGIMLPGQVAATAATPTSFMAPGGGAGGGMGGGAATGGMSAGSASPMTMPAMPPMPGSGGAGGMGGGAGSSGGSGGAAPGQEAMQAPAAPNAGGGAGGDRGGARKDAELPQTIMRLKLDTRDDDYDEKLVVTYAFDNMPENLSYSKYKPMLRNAVRLTLLGNLQEGLDMFKMVREQNLPKEFKDMIDKNIQDITYFLRGMYRAQLEQ